MSWPTWRSPSCSWGSKAAVCRNGRLSTCTHAPWLARYATPPRFECPSLLQQHAVNILADAYLWGVGGVNYTAAYALMTAAAVATTGNCTRRDVSHYAALGYVPVESSSVAACLTIAYAHNDLAISALGAALGMPDAPEFAARSENYRNVWSAKERFYCPRHVDGSWLCPNKLGAREATRFSRSLTLPPGSDVFSPYYVEGDAWHYRFDGTDPLALFGSAKDFAKALRHGGAMVVDAHLTTLGQ